MALTPRLDSREATFRKLEGELVRTFHHQNLTHKADHFYNFCITAHSVRDYFLERLRKITRADRKAFNDTWSKNPVLVAVADIANTAKHFQLRDPNGSLRPARTKQVRHGKTTVVRVYVDANGKLVIRKRVGVPTYVVEVDRGKSFELYSFMDEVLKHWKSEMKVYGIRIRRQVSKTLHGT